MYSTCTESFLELSATSSICYVTHVKESCRTHEKACAHEQVMGHMWMSYVSRMNKSCHTYEYVVCHVWMSYVTRMSESCHTCKRVMCYV